MTYNKKLGTSMRKQREAETFSDIIAQNQGGEVEAKAETPAFRE